MGSRDLDAEDIKEEIIVLVTGFGPFGNNRINPSHLIASTLPSSFTADNLPNIKIVTATPIPAEYHLVRNAVPRLLFPQTPAKARINVSAPMGDALSLSLEDLLLVDSTVESRPRFDFVVHIGMAAPRKYFTMETHAHRDGYVARDEAGESLEGDTFWRDRYEAPETLNPGFDVEDVWRRWKSELVGIDVRTSNDAGRYLCDFIYYASLVEYWRRNPGMKAPVMFLHVPGKIEELDIEIGRKVTLGLIGAMVGSAMRDKGGASGDG
ncbi:MAG: hypothetical protein Q9219_002978 [cf. Caloplaca sp. 3 TL-2023]